ncbi:ABC transporter substrate-binding protein [Nocardioides sp. LHG3406-4]|uniref:ABC transporter substrate-binding protein n=1 Tax=Nocardioides sp. LHG3406-4 TaxID=2804575 RepID=UPI003CF78017
MNRKLVVAAVGCVGVLTALAGCGSDGSSSAAEDGKSPSYGNCHPTGTYGSDPIKPAVAGQLTVETSLPSPGWWNGDTPDTIKDGFEYCMAAEIAHRAGLPKLKVEAVAFDSIVTGRTKDFDVALVTISITPERQEVVDFSPPYFSGDIGVLVKEGETVTTDALEGMEIGVQLGTAGQSFAQDKLGIPDSQLKVFPDTGTMTTALASGQVDAVLNDTVQALTVANASSGRLEVVGQFKTGESYGGVYPKGSPNKAALDTIITAMNDDGTLKELSSEYLASTFGKDPTTVPYLDLP